MRDMDIITLEYLYAVTIAEEEDKFERLSIFLGMTWTKQDVMSLISSGSGASRPESMTLPLALAVNPELTDVLKASFGLEGKEGYSSDAHTDSLIGGKMVRSADGVEIVEIDERFSKDQAKTFFEGTENSAKPLPEGVGFDPATLKNEPNSIVSNELPEDLRRLLHDTLGKG